MGLVTFCTDSYGKRSQSAELDELWKTGNSFRRRAFRYVQGRPGYHGTFQVAGAESFRRRFGLSSNAFKSGIVGHPKYRSSFPRRFDAMTVVIYAISDMLHAGHKPADIKGAALYKTMLQQKFEGLAGTIQFDAMGGWKQSVQILNLRANWVNVANFSQGSIHMEHGQTFIWPGNTSTIPIG